MRLCGPWNRVGRIVVLKDEDKLITCEGTVSYAFWKRHTANLRTLRTNYASSFFGTVPKITSHKTELTPKPFSGAL